MSVMDVVSLRRVVSFTTKDGSEIRELHHTEAQSLAEATLEPDQATQRHYHRRSEEIYFVLKGSGDMEIDGEHRRVTVDDAVLTRGLEDCEDEVIAQTAVELGQ